MNKPYLFVRRKGRRVEGVVFALFSNGNCGFNVELDAATFLGYTYLCDPDGWKEALGDLEELGFVEAEEAKRQNLVPPNWQPDEHLRGEFALIERLVRRYGSPGPREFTPPAGSVIRGTE
ncbi:MAG: hypothetical protein JXB62_00285 [Pirellulales bacterium]|nr:hypothetical protein [Pirellulales bacterium]